MAKQPPPGRFGTLMQKLKEQPAAIPTTDEFDPTLSEAVRPLPEVPSAPRKRPPAKKNNPDYAQTTVYLKKILYDRMGKRLIDEGRVRDYSDLVNNLIEQWVNSDVQTSERSDV